MGTPANLRWREPMTIARTGGGRPMQRSLPLHPDQMSGAVGFQVIDSSVKMGKPASAGAGILERPTGPLPACVGLRFATVADFRVSGSVRRGALR